jgi:endonuclease/exonuclease/phosphatase family metal-dependent hydrolase
MGSQSMGRFKKWGVRVVDTSDRRSNDRPLRLDRCFTKIGAEIRAHRLFQSLNAPQGPITFLVEAILL